jgi:prepilin-type N-terminal cleavage/methylation domain-containing protein/prepilin-type processing-associated H-X9-DG protein
MKHTRKGFTLIELLVVIAIILILAAILFPVFAKVRSKALQTTCANNLKQLGIASEMYQTAWGDVLVPFGAPFNVQSGIWYSLLDPYLKQIPGGNFDNTNLGKIFRCPAAAEEEVQGWAYQRSYGLNLRCGGWFNRDDPINAPEKVIVIPVSRAKYPSQTVRVAEGDWEPAAGGGQGGSALAPDPNIDDGRSFPGRHNGSGEVLWIDGHVTTMTPGQYNRLDNQTVRSVWLRLSGPKPQN